MKITDPYSPTARAKASVKPVITAGRTGGNTTRQRMLMREAPSMAADSSSSRSKSRSTGSTVRTTKGSPTKTSAMRMPMGGIEAGEGDPGHRGRQRKRQIDQRIDNPPARELVANENPGND